MIELKKKYKSGSATEILQEAILFGDIKGDTEVTQNELASALGTSRMPVREALIALEYQGLIERRTNQHVVIPYLFDSSIYEIFRDMAAIEIEVIKNWEPERIMVLSVCREQKVFHELIYKASWSLLRKNLLKMTAEIYLPFVLNNTRNTSKIDSVFGNLRNTMNPPVNMDMIRSAYTVYSEVLAKELIRIRMER